MLYAIRHKSYLLMLALCAVLVSLVSCSDRSDEPQVRPVEDVRQAVFTINLGDAARLAGRATPTDGEYDQGSGLENYIDIEGYDYACYLFTSGNVLVSELVVTNMFKIDSDGAGRLYTVRAALRQFEVAAIEKGCKLVVLANWGDYPHVEAGRTTISDLCDMAAARFEYTADMNALAFDADKVNLIPMYGVKAIPAGAATIDGDTYRVDDIRLLRAYAKVEVKPTFLNFPVQADPYIKSIEMTNSHTAGYKLPAAQYILDETGYVHGSWYRDYTPVNIPADADVIEVPFCRADDSYVLFMPEYDNVDADGRPRPASERARIRVTFVTDGDLECTGYLDFCTTTSTISVGSDTPDAAAERTYVNIARNNWYKFDVSITAHEITWTVDVQPYALADLRPGFGIERDDLGNILVRNEDGKIIRIITPAGETYEGSDFDFGDGISGSNFIDKNNNVMIRLFDDGRRQIFEIDRSWDLYETDGTLLEMFDYDDATTGTWSRFDPYEVLIERKLGATLAENQLDISGGSPDVRFTDDKGGQDASRTKDVEYLFGTSEWRKMVHVEVVYHFDGTLAAAINAPYTQKFRQEDKVYTRVVKGDSITQRARELYISDDGGTTYDLRFRYYEDKSYQKLYTDGSFDTFTADGVRTTSYSSNDPNYSGRTSLTYYDPWNHIVERWLDVVPNDDRTNATCKDENKVVKYQLASPAPVRPLDLLFSIYYKIDGGWIKFYDIAKNGEIISIY